MMTRGDPPRGQHADRAHPYALPAPMRPQAYRGPDSGEIVPTSHRSRMARWSRLWLGHGCVGAAELADAERINRSYVSRVLRLALLAPEIIESIRDGRPAAGLMQFLKRLPVEWERQRDQFRSSDP